MTTANTAMQPRGALEFAAVVQQRDIVARDVVLLTLGRADGAPWPAWSPGAHIDLLLDGGLVRQYSLCGDPRLPDEWRVAVLLEPGGRGGSSYIHEQLRVGAAVAVRGPRNHFAVQSASRYLFIAGGIGITPIVPMLAMVTAAGASWRLVYGGRQQASMAFLDELAAYGDRVQLWPQDTCGLLPLAALLTDPDDETLVYCCGPEVLLEAVERGCAGWPAGALHVERFSPRPLPAAAPVGRFDVVLRKSGKTLTVAPEESILEAVERAGVAVLSSCREGTCGTCETDVVEGSPDHRDSVLTQGERAANDVMMICVSRACSARLVLEL